MAAAYAFDTPPPTRGGSTAALHAAPSADELACYAHPADAAVQLHNTTDGAVYAAHLLLRGVDASVHVAAELTIALPGQASIQLHLLVRMKINGLAVQSQV